MNNTNGRREIIAHPDDAPQADIGFMRYWKLIMAYLAASVIASWELVSWYAPETHHFAFGVGLGVAFFLVIGSSLYFLHVLRLVAKGPTK